VIKVGSLRGKEVRECVPQVSLVGEGSPTEVVVEGMKQVVQGPVNMMHDTVSSSKVAEGSPGSSLPHVAWHIHGGKSHPCDSPMPAPSVAMHGAPFATVASRGQQ